MTQPFIGEIRMFGGSFAPAGWAFCDGQLIPISENDALFTLIGTIFGGDGEETFALPDLRGRVPIHQVSASGFTLGQAAGTEEVTLTTQQIPVHTHTLLASTDVASTNNPANQVLAQDAFVGADPYQSASPTVNMALTAITPVGGSQPHTNFQPYLCISYIISLYGIFPPPN